MEENIIGQPALQPIGGQVLSEESFNLDDPVFVNDADMVDDPSVNEEGHPYFIEGPASSYTYEDLQKMTIPVFAATNELSLANTDIAKAVYSAAAKVFGLENLSPLEFRGSHMRKARIVSAQDLKEAPEDQEDKTTSYLERLACCFTVKSYAKTICEHETDVCCGFIRSYHTTNLYSSKQPERVSLWCARRVRVCSNLCLTVTGLKEDVQVMSVNDVYAAAIEVMQSYLKNADEDNRILEGLSQTRISIPQYKMLIGSLRYYMSMDPKGRKELPEMDIQLGDAQCYEACRLFIDSQWGLKDGEASLDLFRLLQTFTDACKNAYLHNYLSKQKSCYTLIQNLQKVLEGENNNPYAWLLSA